MSAPRYMLDTNICICIARKQPPALLSRFEKLKRGEAVLSIITYGELRYGAAKSRQREAVLRYLDELVSLLPVQPLPVAAAEHYGIIRAQLEEKGRPIGGNDLWIAAHAVAEGLTLVTNNTKEFSRIRELEVQNWVA